MTISLTHEHVSDALQKLAAPVGNRTRLPILHLNILLHIFNSVLQHTTHLRKWILRALVDLTEENVFLARRLHRLALSDALLDLVLFDGAHCFYEHVEDFQGLLEVLFDPFV